MSSSLMSTAEEAIPRWQATRYRLVRLARRLTAKSWIIIIDLTGGRWV
jgi:hypothetical protein